MPEQKKILILAGPNGAGKTTFANAFLPSEIGCPIIINAELIAVGVAPFQSETAVVAAGRLCSADSIQFDQVDKNLVDA
jgi:predicted ABC-type ATPase